MDDWTAYLPNNGTKTQPPSVPGGTLGLDNAIENDSLSNNNLYGMFNNIITVGQSPLGGGYIRIDGTRKQFLINDGSNDRILIGYYQNGF